MSGNKRVFYACMGVEIGAGRLVGATSVGISASRDVSTIFASQNKNPVATYAAFPQIEITVSSYLDSFKNLEDEVGLDEFTKISILAGPDESPVLAANQKNTFQYCLLSGVKYNLPAEGYFTVERTYKGLRKKPCSTGGSNSIGGQEGEVKTRQYYQSGKPSVIGDNPINNISIEAKINRSFVNEFGTRKPYASYINFPIEVSCTYECAVQDFDSISFDLNDTACKNLKADKEDIMIQICGSSFTINEAQLTNFNYSGGEANNGSNLTFSVTYTGYTSPPNIVPVIIIPDTFLDPC